MSNQASTTTEAKTLKETADVYLEHLAAGSTKPSTVNVYRKALDLAITHFGAERKLDSILLPQVGKFYKSDALNILPSGKPKAEPTVKQNKRVFRQMMEYAQTKGWIIILPIPKGELQHARSSKAIKPEVETPERVEAEAPAEAETQN